MLSLKIVFHRYFDGNRDLKLEYVEFKELVAAARAARQLPVDALSVARDADVCLRYSYSKLQYVEFKDLLAAAAQVFLLPPSNP